LPPPLRRRPPRKTPQSPHVAAPAAEAAAPEDAPVAAPVAPATPAAPRLFGSVTNHDLSEALAAHGLAVDKKKILLPEPIKTLGLHKVPVRLHADVLAELTVTVEREA
jgi:large subunit ribosomal protein L9